VFSLIIIRVGLGLSASADTNANDMESSTRHEFRLDTLFTQDHEPFIAAEAADITQASSSLNESSFSPNKIGSHRCVDAGSVQR
jgi:hypothetical protein